MGKWILYGLILLNLIAFLWFYSNSEADTVQPKQQPISLLNSEKISMVKANTETQPLPTEAEQQTEQQIDSSQDELTENPLQAIIDQKATEQSAIVKSEPILNTPSQGEVSQIVAEPITQKLPENNQALIEVANDSANDSANNSANNSADKSSTSNQIETTASVTTPEEQKLLDEMASFSSNVVDETVQTPSLSMLCYQYGPLNQIQAEAITAVMQQQQIPMIQQNRTLVEQRGFLVLIMPQKNSNGAKSEMRAARKAGLDAFTITKGEWIHGVSLGIFSAKENADKLFNRVRGLIPKSEISIKKRVRESEVYRILFKLKNEQDPAVLLANNPFPSFNSENPLQKTTKIAKKSCETVEF